MGWFKKSDEEKAMDYIAHETPLYRHYSTDETTYEINNRLGLDLSEAQVRKAVQDVRDGLGLPYKNLDPTDD